jgi:hypothetical protein
MAKVPRTAPRLARPDRHHFAAEARGGAVGGLRRRLPRRERRGRLASLARSRRVARKGPSLPWIVGSTGLGLLVAIQIGVNVVGGAPARRTLRQPGQRPRGARVSTPPYNSTRRRPDGTRPTSPPGAATSRSSTTNGFSTTWKTAARDPLVRERPVEENRAHVAALEAVVPRAYPRRHRPARRHAHHLRAHGVAAPAALRRDRRRGHAGLHRRLPRHRQPPVTSGPKLHARIGPSGRRSIAA